MNRWRLRLLRVASLSLLISLALLGCGGTSSPGDGGDGNGGDGCQGNGVQALSVVGDPNRTLYPSGETDLQVVLLEKCVGAVAGATVEYQILQGPPEVTLSASTATTAANGVAKVTLRAGSRTGSFQVWARTAGDSEGVYFSITIKPVRRQLSAVGSKNLEVYVGDSIDLTVKLLDVDTSAPVSGVSIAYSIGQPAPGDAALRESKASTNVSGLATANFLAGSVATTYSVSAQGETEQVGVVTFSVKVKPRTSCTDSSQCPPGFVCVNNVCRDDSGGGSCSTNDQCPPGYVCQNQKCVPEGSLPESCNISDECPAGYYCENHRCYPCASTSTDPKCQGQPTGCTCTNGTLTCDKNGVTPGKCPPGFGCCQGVCCPDNDPTAQIPNLAGTWYTKHYFNTQAALGDAGSIMTQALDILNRIINYCDLPFIGDIPIIGDLLEDLACDLIHQYVPDWVGTLVSILDNLANILAELRSEGTMRLTHLNPRELVSGTEVWNKILVRYLDACCLNQPPGCNPFSRPNFPQCATIDISRQDLEFAQVGLTVEPFTGKIQVDTSGATPKYTLLIDPRKVNMEVSKFVLYLVNLLISIFTPYDDLDDALQHIIDCNAIANFAYDLCDDWFGSFVNCNSAYNAALNGCNNFKPNAASILGALLDRIGVGWKVLQFTGYATVTTQGDPPYGIKLGFPNYEQSQDGKWEGTFTIVISGDVPGAWYGER